MTHQYIDRKTATVKDEYLFGDPLVRLLFSHQKENPRFFFNALASRTATQLLSFLNYDIPALFKAAYTRRLVRQLGIDLSECIDPEKLVTPRDIFERQIKYWENRPMPEGEGKIVSPADAKLLVGSFADTHQLFLKDKFFSYRELLGPGKRRWIHAFDNGPFAVFRLTPEKYHYNHTPVSGNVADIYEIDGLCHSCNPTAVVALSTPYSKNRRVVTVMDTDVPGGSRVGLVAMIEITALLIGDIIQCYSSHQYDHPSDVTPGMMLAKGQPKSLYRPGSSVDVLIFQPGRIRFCNDIVANMHHPHARSRLSHGFGRPLVETDVMVRSVIGERR